jgi:hypothetical protein
MSAGFKCRKIVEVCVLCAIVCVGGLNATDSTSTHRRKAKKPQLPPLPSGPTGRPVPQIPLDSIKPVAPQVSFQNGQLTIVAPNSTLGDILRAVRKQTGAEIEIPEAQERVVTRLGPGPARDVVAELLNGSRFNYVLLGSPEDANQLTRVVLVAKSGPENSAKPQQPGAQANAASAQPEMGQDPSDSDSPDDNAINDDNNNADQPSAAEAEPPAQPEQPGVKTPQQMLQEMQQRQMQFQQQQQQNGGPPMPTPGMPLGVPQPPQPQPQDQ